MAAAELENILKKLLVSDNSVIQQGYVELKRAFTKPDIVVPALAELLKSSSEPTIRQYSAILLRRRTVKHWKNLPADVRGSLKNLLIECVTKESSALVHSSLCQVIGSIARNDLPSNNWPELMHLISRCVQSSVANEREVGYSLLSFISDMAAEQLKPWCIELFPVFEKGLVDGQSKHSAYCVIKCFTSLLPFFGSDEEKLLKPLLGKVMDVIKYFLKEDEDKANELLDIFDELVQIEIGIIIPYVRQLVEFCMQIVSSNELSDGLRVKALYLICWACRRKSKTLWKSNMLKPLVLLLLQLMSIPEEDDLENDEEGNDTNSLPAVAAQALDLLALHSPAEKLIPILMESLSPLFSSEDCCQRKAAYLALGELAEGCSEYLRTRHLSNVVETCMKGLNDGSVIVRNASLFSLGQYAEHIQPEFGKFHSTILPVLLTFLHTVVNDTNAKVNHRGTLTKLFYAIEKISEGLEKDVVKEYTPGLMDAFLSLLRVSKTLHDRELAISAIGALVMSAQGHLSSYFPLIMENIKVIIMEPITIDTLDIHSQAVDTLGALARYIDPEVFLPVAQECMQLGIKIIEDCDDPDLRRCTYGLFASISVVLKTEMISYLPSIVSPMINSIKSVEGIVPNYEGDGDPSFLIDDETEEAEICNGGTDGDDEEDENISGYTVENSYMEEKEDAINSITEIAENVGNGIQTFLEEIYNEIFLLVDYPHCNVRKASVTAGCRLCVAAYKIVKENSLDMTPVQNFIQRSFPTVLNVIGKDDDRSVVIACVEVLEELIKELQGDLLNEKKCIQELAGTILILFQGKTNCQQFEDDNLSNVSVDDDESSAELDQMLIEKTGELLPHFAKAIGGLNFKEYFNLYLPIILKKTKKNSTVSERSFAAGTVAEVIQAMENAITDYVPTIFPWLLGLLQDANDEVRSNAAFALGVMAEYGKEVVTSLYGSILQALFGMLSGEEQPPLVQDNVCGAVSRMIITSPGSLPLDQVLPILVGCLPIKEDESENETVTFCFLQLYANNSNMLLPYMEKLIPWFVDSIQNEKSGLKDTTREQTKMLVADLESKYPSEFSRLVASKMNGNH